MTRSLVWFAVFAIAAYPLSACAKRTEEARPQPTTEPSKVSELANAEPQLRLIELRDGRKPEPPSLPKSQEPGQKPGKSKGGGFGSLPLPKLPVLLPSGSSPPTFTDPTRIQKYTAALTGTWIAHLGDGVTEELTYKADGTYTVVRKGTDAQSANGKYTVAGPSGTRGLRLTVDSGSGPRTIHVVFEEDELIHPTLRPGVNGIYRRKK